MEAKRGEGAGGARVPAVLKHGPNPIGTFVLVDDEREAPAHNLWPVVTTAELEIINGQSYRRLRKAQRPGVFEAMLLGKRVFGRGTRLVDATRLIRFDEAPRRRLFGGRGRGALPPQEMEYDDDDE